MPSINASPFSEGMCRIAGEPLSAYAPMADILATSCELQKSLNKCAVFYSGLEVCPELGMDNPQSVLETLLCQGLRESRLPSWSLAAHRNRVHICGLKVEDMCPGRESEIDITLRPIRAAMYSLILPSGNGNHEQDSIVTEYVRVGHDELPVHVHAISSDIIASALGSSDLLFLRQCDEQRRQRILHCFLHLPVDVSILCTEAIDEEFLQLDPLLRLPDFISITQKDPVQMPFRVIGIIFRVLFAMCKSRVSSGVKAGDNLDHYIHVGAGEYEALMKQTILLNCGFDASSLPALTPSPHTAQVASLFLATISAVSAAAELLDTGFWMPEPAQLFSGRLFAHFHMSTSDADKLMVVNWDLFRRESTFFKSIVRFETVTCIAVYM